MAVIPILPLKGPNRTKLVMLGVSSASFFSAVVVLAVALLFGVSCEGVTNEPGESQSQTHDTIRDCLIQLEVHQVDRGLTREEFVSLIESLSHGQTGVLSSKRLPLQYSSIFNMNACLNGKDCLGNHAMISISSDRERALVCSSILPLLMGTCDGSDGGANSSATCPVDQVVMGRSLRHEEQDDSD